MKKIILATLAFVCFISIPTFLQAQCYPLVPSNVQVIPFGANDSSMNYPGSTHNVCFNSYYYYYNNNPDTIYLDASSLLTIGWCQNLTLYMRSNCQLFIDTTTFGIYHIKKLVYDTAYTNLMDTSYATIDSAIACPGLTFNYSNFAGNNSPCFLFGEDKEEETNILIYPTVTSGDIRIETQLPDYYVEIHDITGRKIVSAENKNMVSIAGHSPGIYLLSVIYDHKTIRTQKMILTR